MKQPEQGITKPTGRVITLFLAVCMALSLCGFDAFAAEEEGQEDAITLTYGDYTFTKVSNPTSGSREADGINTNDETGFPANRLNSYAWAVASRGDYIYIGTNRTLFGSAMNAVVEVWQERFPDLSMEAMGKVIGLVSGGDVPVNPTEEDYIPQIIRFDVRNGTTKVIYQPKTAKGVDGKLYYTDKDGNIMLASDVASETASFRSVIEYNGNLYFGSLGTNMLQLVRVDENDQAEVVFQTLGLISSLRACALYDDGDGETIYYGGQDTTYLPWRAYRQSHPNEAYPLPIVIRYLDPATAGTDSENWDGLVADFNDFGKYAFTSVYSNGGGTVWDLVNYNGKLYLILAYEGGWAMFRGEKGGANPNKFGWTWTEIVGDNGKYPLAMNSEIAEKNKKLAEDYGCAAFAANLNGTGLLESTATPYVYNGKMYIGSFDNATMLQSQTVIKAMIKVMCLKNMQTGGSTGPSLEQIFAPLYEALTNPQHIWVMDENENITAVDGANELLADTTNDYVWRFIEYNGKLYAGTFDSSSAYIYFLDYSIRNLYNYLSEHKDELTGNSKDLFDGTIKEKLQKLLPASSGGLVATILAAAKSAEGFVKGTVTVEELQKNMEALEKITSVDWETMVNDAEKTASDTVARTVEYLTNLIQDLEEKTRTALATAREKAAKLLADAKETADALLDKANELSEEKLKEYTDAAKEKVAEAEAAASDKLDEIKAEAEELIEKGKAAADEILAEAKEKADEVIAKAKETADQLVEEVTTKASEKLEELKEELADASEETENYRKELVENLEKAQAMIDWLKNYFDVEGLTYWVKARAIAKNAEKGFDLLVSEDGETWEKVLTDGLEDIYNYGARTFTICNDELYLGTANPYYGAQLWKVSDGSEEPEPEPQPKAKWVKTKAGWKYKEADGSFVIDDWRKVSGKWYYFDKSGIMEGNAYREGYYLKKSGAWDGVSKKAQWRKTSKGWWYRLPDGSYLAKTWKKIDGKWYYFKADGYMAESEYVEGYSIGRDGAWDGSPKASWKQDSTGWKYIDTKGWYPKSRTLVIDGKSYTFDAKGYVVE